MDITIGEVFNVEGVDYVCRESDNCGACDLPVGYCAVYPCRASCRPDGKMVIYRRKRGKKNENN